MVESNNDYSIKNKHDLNDQNEKSISTSKSISHINDARESKYVKISSVKKFFKQIQTLRLENNEVVDLRGNIRLMGTSLDLIIQSLNDYIENQLKLLKYSIPKKNKGENKGEDKFNTILDRIVKESGFPTIPSPSK